VWIYAREDAKLLGCDCKFGDEMILLDFKL